MRLRDQCFLAQCATIRDESVISTGSVVTRDITPRLVAEGNRSLVTRPIEPQ